MQDDIDRGRLAAVLDAMRAHPADNHTLTALAKRAGMSRSTFAHEFRRRFGRSPMELLRTIRLDHAAQLLRATAMPVKNVGADAGYNSRTSFSNAFQRAFGMSPAEYRAAQQSPARDDIHAISQRMRQPGAASQHLAWEVDLASGAVWWSEATFAALGYTRAKRPVSDVARLYERIHPQDRERIVRGMQSAASDRSLTWQDQFSFKRPDGRFVRTANGCIILRNDQGAAVKLVGVMRIDEPEGSAGADDHRLAA